MSTLLSKLRQRFERNSDLPLGRRLAIQASDVALYAVHVAQASVWLRDCNRVGPWARTAGGAPSIENFGRIEAGAHLLLMSTFSPVRMVTAQGARLRLGDRVVVNFGTLMSARASVTIGSDVSFGPYCIISDCALEARDDSAADAAPISIGDRVWLAGRVTVLPGSSIGSDSVITAGSIVAGDIPAGVVAGGNPARVLRRLRPGEHPSIDHPAFVGDVVAELRAVPSPAAHLDPVASIDHVEIPRPPKMPSAPGLGITTDPKPAGVERHALRGYVIADFTADDLAARLTEDPHAPYIDAEVAPFGQVIPSLLALSTDDTPPELVVVWTRPQNAIPLFQHLLAFETVAEADLLAQVDEYAHILTRSLARVKCAVVPTWTLPPYHRGWGLMDTRPGGATRALQAMNLRLMDSLAGASNIHVLNVQRCVEAAGKQAQNPKLWYMGKVAFSGDTFAEVTREIKSALTAVQGGARKLVVLDLDDTLWGGIVGDAGWENLRLGGHDSVGESFVDFQRALKNLKRRGIVLAIASKNEESVALEAIRSHPEMQLREDDFVAWRINWNDKAANVAAIASELNLGLQSVVFIDDNPVERARVKEQLPEVLVPDWPEDKLLYVSTLLSMRCFDTPTLTQEDRERTNMYVAERKRAADEQQVGSMEDWLASLQISVRAAHLMPSSEARAAQLLNKTNQLNLRTRRLTQQELQTWSTQPHHELFSISVSDKYGDSGLTGLVSVDFEGNTARIIDFILSCRVMGRKVEETLVHIAVDAARRRGLGKVEATLIPTAKNKPCLAFWQRSGFVRTADNTFVWDASQPYPCPETIALSYEQEGGSTTP
jgi:FkbH-like protein